MENKIKGVLAGIVIGNSLGNPVVGLSKGHIRSIFKEITNYTDPLPALKGKTHKWRKPALYSSLSQMMLILSCVSTLQKNRQYSEFYKYIQKGIEIGEGDYGIFRHPSAMDRNLFDGIRKSKPDSTPVISAFSMPCARLIPVIIPAALNNSKSKMDFILNIISLSRIFNTNDFAIGASLAFGMTIRRFLYEDDNSSIDPILAAIEETDKLLQLISDSSHAIFELKFNPDSLLNSIIEFSRILNIIETINNNEDAEERICKQVNRFLKSPIKRASVNHPLSIAPFAIYLAGTQKHDPTAALFMSLCEGGETSVLCSLTGSMMGAMFGIEWISKNLIEGLVNKKRVFNIIDSIAENRISEKIIFDFLKCEAPLTLKEIEEFQAKIKHFSPNIRANKSRAVREDKLTKHVVESWTKIDKAKWRKEKRKRGE